MGRALLVTERIGRLRTADNQLIGVPRADDEARPLSAPMEDLDVVLVDSAVPVVLDSGVLRQLAEFGVLLIVTDAHHLPLGSLVNMYGTSDHGRIVESQVSMSLPRKKRLWQQLVSAKIINQAANISDPHASARLLRLARETRSGDTNNNEAQAARIYWTHLVDTAFRRIPATRQGMNAALDYTYSVLRSLIARSVVNVGIAPAIAVFHSNKTNPFAFVDDLIEPFRPFADRHVLATDLVNGQTLTREDRGKLVSVMNSIASLDNREGPLSEVVERFAARVKKYVIGESDRVSMPSFPGYG